MVFSLGCVEKLGLSSSLVKVHGFSYRNTHYIKGLYIAFDTFNKISQLLFLLCTVVVVFLCAFCA